jgi:hypothetical protein
MGLSINMKGMLGSGRKIIAVADKVLAASPICSMLFCIHYGLVIAVQLLK